MGPIIAAFVFIALFCGFVSEDSYPTHDRDAVLAIGHDSRSTADLDDTDAQKYASTNFSFICDFNRRTSKLFTGAHHKTGSSLLNVYFVNTLIKYYIAQCIASQSETNAMIPTTKRDRFDVEWRIGHGHTDANKLRSFVASRRNSEQHFVILHLIRRPIDTVLSGYHYHAVT